MLLLISSFVTHASGADQDYSDGEIAKIMQTANEREIASALLAQEMASHSEVRSYANKMMSAHTLNLNDLTSLVNDQKIVLSENPESQKMKQDGQSMMNDLRRRANKDFDRVYMYQQVRRHRDLLNALKANLTPAADSPALKRYLRTTLSAVQTHLNEAIRIQGMLPL